MGLSISATLHLLTATAILAAVCASAQATPQATTIVEPATPLLPTNAIFSNDDAITTIPSEDATWDKIQKEDGLVRRESRSLADGWIKAYQFVDFTGAYSAYTYLRQQSHLTGGARVNNTEIVLADGTTVFQSGISVVVARLGRTPGGAELLKTVDVGLPKVSGRKALAPRLPTLFPADVSGTKPDLTTLRYSLGPVAYQAMGGTLPPEILGWDKSAEIATAAYSGRAGKGTLTLLLYPTPQIAGERGRAIEQAINDKGVATFGTVKLRRIGPLVGLATGAFSPDQAEKLVQALNLNEQVSFDQKLPLEFHAEVRKTATLLQSILIFTGLLCLAAIVIGVFLGGVRAGWRVMHGKPAHSEPEFLTINLRDKPKALFGPREPGSDEPQT